MPYLQPLLFLAALTLAILSLIRYSTPRWHVIREGNHYGVYHPQTPAHVDIAVSAPQKRPSGMRPPESVARERL